MSKKGDLYLLDAGRIVHVSGAPVEIEKSALVRSVTNLRGLTGVVGPVVPLSLGAIEGEPAKAAQVSPEANGEQVSPAAIGLGQRDPWANRYSGMRCRTCIFYVEKVRVLGNMTEAPIGRCRRHAPTMSGYPVVFPADRCGDHKLDEQKA